MVLPRMKHSGILQNLSPSCRRQSGCGIHALYIKDKRTDSRGADDISELDVHPRVAVDQVTIVGLTVLQLHQLCAQQHSTH